MNFIYRPQKSYSRENTSSIAFMYNRSVLFDIELENRKLIKKIKSRCFVQQILERIGIPCIIAPQLTSSIWTLFLYSSVNSGYTQGLKSGFF